MARVKELYENVTDFDELLGVAEEKQVGDFQAGFVETLRANFDKYRGDMFISDKQVAILKRIAGEEE